MNDLDVVGKTPGFKKPELSQAKLEELPHVKVMDEKGGFRDAEITGERPLTIYVDKHEIVTLMTLGGEPELLTLGYLYNQRIINDLREIRSIQVDWDVDASVVTTWNGIEGLQERLGQRTVTTGCGQGTIYGSILDELENIELSSVRFSQETFYNLLKRIKDYNEVYKRSGSVHGCALCQEDEVLVFIEDVGRHNAVDAIAGKMLLEGMNGKDKLFYTTGRLTSEMVLKVAQMGIPILISRSGVTQMGLELARKTGVTLISRAGGKHFLVYHGFDTLELDAKPSL